MCFNLDANRFYGDSTISEIVERNIVAFLNHGFLEIGAYINVPSGKRNPQGQDMSALYPIASTGITSNTVWRGVKNNWVWEATGVTLKYSSGTLPIVPSGIYYNGNFVPTGTSITGTGYILDFSRGQVVFANPVPSTNSVQVPHSDRVVSVYSSDSNEYRESILNWQNTSATGINPGFKAYYPAIFVNIAQEETIRGTELGSRGKLMRSEIEFEIFALSSAELKKLTDILFMLETKFIQFFDPQNSPKPLNHRGELVRRDLSYGYWINNYYYGGGRFAEDAVTYKQKNQNLPIHRGRVRIGLEFDVVPI